jgi:putative ABC transport system permease protein
MNQPGEPVVRARNLRKDYGSGEGLVRAVDGIDLDVIRGETVAVMGPSGCGKSTLLHLLGGLDRPAAGELWLAGQRIDEMSERALAHLRRSDVGFVFQAFQLMDELTVLENVELPALAGSARPGRCRTALAGSPRPRQPGQPAHLLPQPPPVRPGCRAGFVSRHQPPPANGPAALTSWQSLSAAAGTLVSQEQNVLSPASWLLSLLALATVAVVAGGRMAEQERRVGLLKAAGATPSLAAIVLLAEHLVIAICAAGVGLAAGWLVAPLLTSPGASLVGAASAPALTLATVLLVVVVALVVATASTLVPAVRAARISTVRLLAGTVRSPRRQAWLIQLSSGLPVPLLLGLRLVGRRPRRTLLSGASFTVTAATIVAVLIYHATVHHDALPAGPYSGAADPGQARVDQVLLVVTVIMVVLAAANALFTTWATVLDARRFSAIARSLGTTPRQTASSLLVTQLLPALAGALLGIPVGIALYGAVQEGGSQAGLPLVWLLFLVLGMLAAVVTLTAAPASISTRHPIAQILQSETA